MLEINGKEYGVNFNIEFGDRLIHDYAVKNDKGQETLDGFSHFINQLLDNDPDAITNAYRYALDCPDKSLPALKDVAIALEKAGVYKQKDVFNDLFKKVMDNGFLTLKLKAYLTSRQNLVDVSKKVLNGATDKSQKQDLKAAEVGLDQIKARLKQLEK